MESILQFSLDSPRPGPLDLEMLCNGNHSLENGTYRRLFQKCIPDASICKVSEAFRQSDRPEIVEDLCLFGGIFRIFYYLEYSTMSKIAVIPLPLPKGKGNWINTSDGKMKANLSLVHILTKANNPLNIPICESRPL